MGSDQVAMQPSIAKTAEQPGESVKPLCACPRCAHENFADSRFCSACGAPFPVAPCPHCGAVNPAAAASCHQCHGKLSESSADEPDPIVATEAVKPRSRRPKRSTAAAFAAGAVALAIVVSLGYQAYEMIFYVDLRLDKAPGPTDVSDGLETRRGPVESGPIGRHGAAGDSPAEKVEPGVASVPASASTSQVAPSGPVNAAAESQRPPRQAAVARAASGPGSQPCADTIAPGGLCPPRRGPAEKAETGAPFAPPRASAAGKAAERARPDSVTCTQGAAALGLCTESVQRKE